MTSTNSPSCSSIQRNLPGLIHFILKNAAGIGSLVAGQPSACCRRSCDKRITNLFRVKRSRFSTPGTARRTRVSGGGLFHCTSRSAIRTAMPCAQWMRAPSARTWSWWKRASRPLLLTISPRTNKRTLQTHLAPNVIWSLRDTGPQRNRS